MGRLWQSLILGKLHPHFQHLPVETMIHYNQQAYYNAISRSTKNGDCGAFIDFMLEEILETLNFHVRPKPESGGVSGGVNGGVSNVLIYIEEHGGCRAKEIADAIVIPLRSVERYLAVLKENGAIEFRGAPKTGGYYRTNIE